MLRTKTALLSMLLVASLGVGCGGDDDGDDGQDDGDDDGGTVQDPTDPALYGAPDGEDLAFGVQEGDIRNYFRRQGPVAVHLLTRSGADARIVAAFPANNQGIGIWFSGAGEDTQLWAGADDESDLAAGGGLEAVVRTDEGAARDLNGVRATVRSDATSLTAYLPVLANVRTVRDYGYGLCLENAEQFPELRNETIELVEEHNAVVIRREQIGGDYAMEFLIKGAEGTTVSVLEEQVEPREACAATAGEAAEKLIEISGEGGLEFDVIAASTIGLCRPGISMRVDSRVSRPK